MPTVQANGVEIYYEREGEGDPLLMLMGLGAQLTEWPQGLVDQIVDRGFEVIRIDHRDVGLSQPVDRPAPSAADLASARLLRRKIRVPYSLRDMAADAAATLGEIGIDRAHVVGASMGGMVAQELAIDHPHKVASLTPIMSTTGNRRVGQNSLDILVHLGRRGPTTRDNFVEQSLALFDRIGGPHFDRDVHRDRAERAVARSFRPDAYIRQAAAVITQRDRTSALRSLDVPALVIHGMRDRMVHPSGGRAIAQAIPGARLLMFPDMGHDLPRPRWPEMADAIRSVADLGNERSTSGRLPRVP